MIGISLSSSTFLGVTTAKGKWGSLFGHDLRYDADGKDRLHETLDELADLYNIAGLSRQVAVAKIDVSKNDVPERIEQYPTIKLYPARGMKSVEYNGTYHDQIPVARLHAMFHDQGWHGVDIDFSLARQGSQLGSPLVIAKEDTSPMPTGAPREGIKHDEV